MTSPVPSVPPAGRRWLFFFGLFSILIGGYAIAQPLAITMAIEQALGILLILSGAFSLVSALFGGPRAHRIIIGVLAAVRVAAGVAFLVCVPAGIAALTTLLGAFFLLEGVAFLVTAFALRPHRAWPLALVNGLVTLVLGGLILAHLPSDEPWALGLLYGIYSIFYGASLLALAATPRRTDAA